MEGLHRVLGQGFLKSNAPTANLTLTPRLPGTTWHRCTRLMSHNTAGLAKDAQDGQVSYISQMGARASV